MTVTFAGYVSQLKQCNSCLSHSVDSMSDQTAENTNDRKCHHSWNELQVRSCATNYVNIIVKVASLDRICLSCGIMLTWATNVRKEANT